MSLPRRIMFEPPRSPLSSASCCEGIPNSSMSSLVHSGVMSVLSKKTFPPGRTSLTNLSNDGWLSATRISGVSTSGEPIGVSEMQTEQLQVPPLISGP